MLEAHLRRVLAAPLPGLEAQLRMAPRPRPGWNPLHLPGHLRPAAALLLVYPRAGQHTIPVTVRSARLKKHTGQVSLPGGSVDVGESIEAAALREAAEEVGVVPASVRVVGRLTPLHIPISGFLLHPVVAVADTRPDFQIDQHEVARVIEVSLPQLRDPALVQREVQRHERHGRMLEIDVPFFALDGEKVWGATAMVLAEFLAAVGDDGIGAAAVT